MGWAMNRFSLIVCIATLLSGRPAFADDDTWEKTFFLLSAIDKTGATLNYDTGEKSKVLTSFQGDRPADCPKTSYWMLDHEKVVNCGSGSVYQLTKYKGPVKELMDAYSLVPVKAPKPGTDDPGPSINNDLVK